MKDANDEKIKLARDSNRYLHEYNESQERKLRQDYYNKVRQGLYREGYSLGIDNGDLESATDTVEINGKLVVKKDDNSFKAGYKQGLTDLAERTKQNNSHKSR